MLAVKCPVMTSDFVCRLKIKQGITEEKEVKIYDIEE